VHQSEETIWVVLDFDVYIELDVLIFGLYTTNGLQKKEEKKRFEPLWKKPRIRLHALTSEQSLQKWVWIALVP